MLYVIKCLIRVWNVKYNSVHCAANLLAGVVQYHVSFRCNSLLSLSTSLVEVYHHYYMNSIRAVIIIMMMVPPGFEKTLCTGYVRV